MFLVFCINPICFVMFLWFVIIVLVVTFLWFLRCFVVECIITLVLRVRGCCSYGDSKVLFIISRVFMLWVSVVDCWMLVICSRGLLGVFINIRCV